MVDRARRLLPQPTAVPPSLSLILTSTLYYTYESFIEQVALADTLTSADFGVSCGLFNQSWWETFRYYYDM